MSAGFHKNNDCEACLVVGEAAALPGATPTTAKSLEVESLF